MRWLIREIKKRPILKRKILSIIGSIKKSYMLLVNKIIGINENKIVFVSFRGKSYSDNPRAISEKLHELSPEFEIVWLFNNPKKRKIVPNYVKCINIHSLRAIRELATAKFWIDNFTKPTFIYKSKKQIYIQTWHGDRGFKKILYDAWPDGKRPKPVIESKICDLTISGSKYGNMQYRSAFNYSGEILQVGYPRNDILINVNKTLVRKIKSTINIKDSTKILLYAPTLRREASIKRSSQCVGEIDLVKVLNALENKTNKKWVCLFRAHSAVINLSGLPKDKRFIDVSSYEDMKELLLISDMLITDYSSSAGDFALLKRPIILFQSDKKEYLEKDRTFYFDIKKSPFMVAVNNKELLDIIEDMDKKLVYKNCKEILQFYGTNETGKSSEFVAKYIISK